VAGIPSVADGPGVVALNLRTVQANPNAPVGGFLRVWPSEGLEPITPSINYTSASTYRTDRASTGPIFHHPLFDNLIRPPAPQSAVGPTVRKTCSGSSPEGLL
jgi:hypothetical protein